MPLLPRTPLPLSESEREEMAVFLAVAKLVRLCWISNSPNALQNRVLKIFYQLLVDKYELLYRKISDTFMVTRGLIAKMAAAKNKYLGPSDELFGPAGLYFTSLSVTTKDNIFEHGIIGHIIDLLPRFSGDGFCDAYEAFFHLNNYLHAINFIAHSLGRDIVNDASIVTCNVNRLDYVRCLCESVV